MNPLPNVSVAVKADAYLEAAELIESTAITKDQTAGGWVAYINAALAVEIYLKSFLAKRLLTKLNTGTSVVTQRTERGHDLFELYQKIDPRMQILMLSASNEIDPSINLEELIKTCKDYFFCARYPYEKNSLPILSSDVLNLAHHMKKLVRKVGETTLPKKIKP